MIRSAGWLAIAGTLASLTAALITDRPADAQAAADIPPLLITFSAEPSLHQVPGIGLNLGTWTSWGAEQLSRNVLKNPGFEGVIDRALVRVVDVAPGRFSDDQAWLARPDGFWAGAQWRVVTGAAAGQYGQVLDSRQRGPSGLPDFRLRQTVTGLEEGDIVALTRINDQALPERWWLPEPDADSFATNLELRRPGSPGRRSLGLNPVGDQAVRLYYHLDTIGQRAGRLLPVDGPWQFRLWVHGEPDGTASIRLRFHRHGQPAFFDETRKVLPGWQLVELHFLGHDDHLATPLELLIEVRGGRVHLDDIWLAPAAPDLASSRLAEQAFNPALISLLRQLNPGYLRDWQGQLGDSLNNRLAQPFARRTSRYRPGRSDFFYGLPEFLDLCDLIGARPWLVLPTTLNGDEAVEAGRWLADQLARYSFDEIVIEFGNENWNSLFRPAGIQEAKRHGEAADQLFRALRAGANDHPGLIRAINAQHANPAYALSVARASRQAQLVGLAPYFMSRANQADRDRLPAALFDDDQGRLDQILAALPAGQTAAVYEINLHTTRGDLPPDERAALVESQSAGIALAWHLLGNLERGITRQNVYRAVGFDTYLEDRSALTPLFGVAGNLGPPANLRASGHVLAMINQTLGGDFHALQAPDEVATTLRGGAFRFDQGWTLLLVNRSDQAHDLTVRLPAIGAEGAPPGKDLPIRLTGPGMLRIDCRNPMEIAVDGQSDRQGGCQTQAFP
ncbi:MAG: hypothetical protein ACXIUB_00590 [Wenzhouxiangella sp.]